MGSLRSFHLLFILIAIILADVFGAWAIAEQTHTHDLLTLVVGWASFALSFALIGYALWVVRKMDRGHIE